MQTAQPSASPPVRHALFGTAPLALPPGGPLYLQLKRWLEQAIASGELGPGEALPSERDLAQRAELSRVTVRKAVQQLVAEGLLVQRHGSGTFVAPAGQRVEQSLSQLTSFAEDMARRGMSLTSVWLDRGLYAASPDEMVSLGLSATDRVARLARLRLSSGLPLAIERAAIAADILADPEAVGDSLYAHLEARGSRPVRAMQRIRAIAISGDDARRLDLAPGSAVLQIERLSFLASGRPIEFTRSLYRGDTYDFVAELRTGTHQGDKRT